MQSMVFPCVKHVIAADRSMWCEEYRKEVHNKVATTTEWLLIMIKQASNDISVYNVPINGNNRFEFKFVHVVCSQRHSSPRTHNGIEWSHQTAAPKPQQQYSNAQLSYLLAFHMVLSFVHYPRNPNRRHALADRWAQHVNLSTAGNLRTK